MSADFEVKREFDLKRSTSKIGTLEKVKRSKDGTIFDGLHRKEADPDWPEETREEVDTTYKYWMARLLANSGHRTVPWEETAGDLNEMAMAAQKEMAESKLPANTNIIRMIVEDTGYSELYVRSLLRLLKSKVLRPQRPREPKRREEDEGEEPEISASQAEEQVEEEEPEIREPEVAKRGTVRYEQEVLDTINKSVGLPLGTIKNRLMSLHDMEPEEADSYIEKFKRENSSIWSRAYDDKGMPMASQAKAAMPPPPGISGDVKFVADDDYGVALDHYTEDMLKPVWPKIGTPSLRPRVMRALSGVCFDVAIQHYTIDELLQRAFLLTE